MSKLKDVKEVVAAIVAFTVVLFCSLLVDFNIIDLLYFIFIIYCFIRYIWICKSEKEF